MSLPHFRNALLFGSFTPIGLLWLVRGLPSFPDANFRWFTFPGWVSTALLVILITIIPIVIVESRWAHATKMNQSFKQNIVEVESGQGHLVEFVLSVLLAMFFVDVNEPRQLIAAIIAILLIIGLFAKLGRHHVNLFFFVRGYHLYIATLNPNPSQPKHQYSVYVMSNRGPPPTGKADLLRLDDRLYIYSRP